MHRMREAALYKGFGHSVAQFPAKMALKPRKLGENHKKPVETRLLLLTKTFESRKVNGGGFS
jgi:hypothetical protein